MRDRGSSIAPIAAIAGVVGLCCGLPVLLSLGVLGAVAGLSLQSWALIGLGLALAAFGSARRVMARRSADRSQDAAGPRAAQDRSADATRDTATDGTGS
jgi:type IV secretory pathway TrbD component